MLACSEHVKLICMQTFSHAADISSLEATAVAHAFAWSTTAPAQPSISEDEAHTYLLTTSGTFICLECLELNVQELIAVAASCNCQSRAVRLGCVDQQPHDFTHDAHHDMAFL